MGSAAVDVLVPMPSFLDDEIEALSLQLREVNIYEGKQKGKKAAHMILDPSMASQTFQSELRSKLALLRDMKLAHSIANAVNSDGRVITELLRSEVQAREDRQAALRISSNDRDLEDPPPYTENPTTLVNNTEAFQRDTRLKYEDLFIVSDAEEEAGPSSTYLNHQAEALDEFPKENRQCCTCYDNFRPIDVIKLQCKHIFCAGCLKGLFLRATKDESLFPPKCCRQHIPLSLVRGRMSAEDHQEFVDAELEFSTVERTYCSNLRCGKFIPPSQIRADRAECTRCGAATCKMCQNTFHNDDCNADAALQATLSLAEGQGWKRCVKCKAVVELNTGCYHITCKCGAEWCYLCTERWKTCTCDSWDVRNLGLRAEQIVDREAVQPLRVDERQRRVLQMQGELRERHECNHSQRFEKVFGEGRGSFECEMCNDRHRKYILQCRHCHLRLCEDCRRHRI